MNIRTAPVRRACAVARRRTAGFTIVELMVALTLSLFILIGLVTLFANQSVSRGEIDKASRQIENGRFALQTLSDDLHHAGYYGALIDAPGLPAAIPDPCLTAGITANPGDLGLPVQGYAGAGADPTPTGCLAGYKAGTAVVVVRRASTTLGFINGEFNIQPSGCMGDAARFTVNAASAATAGNFPLHKNSIIHCDPIAAAPMGDIFPLFVRIYYISCNTSSAVACGAAGADGVPTLQRADVKPAGVISTAIVDGIENLQFEYGVDTTSDGAPESYTNIATPPATLAAWGNVMAVRVYLISRNIDTTGGYADAKTYTIGAASTVSLGGAFKRHAYSAVVRLNNPSGRRE